MPSSHIRQKRDKKSRPTHKSRIKRILPKTAKNHLAYHNRNKRSDKSHPERKKRRQTHRKKNTCKKSTSVFYGRRRTSNFARNPFKKHTGNRTHDILYKCISPIINNRKNNSRSKGNAHCAHYIRNAFS